VFYEDQLLVQALKGLGLQCTRKAWDDTAVDWTKTRAVVFRSTWDYFDRFAEFMDWLSEVSAKTRLINSEPLIRWNLDKHYLLDLNNLGIHIPDSLFIERGSFKSLRALHTENGWSRTVLKPCVSGAGRHTYLLEDSTIDAHEEIFQELIAKEAMMIQVFQEQIVSIGEISIMLFNGHYTHAVLKKAKTGDFRVQDDFGGTVHTYKPNKEEIAFAMRAIEACPERPIYARADIFYDNDHKLALGELELIEPELWFRNYPKAATVMAYAIHEQLTTNHEN
jgi:glutathione synthase/RimK-type ligase-like ATP-grasp enzyme